MPHLKMVLIYVLLFMCTVQWSDVFEEGTYLPTFKKHPYTQFFQKIQPSYIPYHQ